MEGRTNRVLGGGVMAAELLPVFNEERKLNLKVSGCILKTQRGFILVQTKVETTNIAK